MPNHFPDSRPTCDDNGFPQRFNGDNLRHRRLALNLTRTAVAKGAGLTRASVKAMERNRIRPSDAAFTRLCRILQMTAEQGRACMMVPGPADHRPDEHATEATAAERDAPSGSPRPNNRGARMLKLRRGGRGSR